MATRTIKVVDFINDIRSGIGDADLMTKYKLTEHGLRKAFTKLLDAGILHLPDIQGRLPTFSSPIDVEGVRVLARNFLAFPVPVFEADNLLVRGIVQDIAESGLRISGIEVTPEEHKNLLIQPDEFHDIYPFVLEARCQWIRREESDGEIIAGFRIVDIATSGA